MTIAWEAHDGQKRKSGEPYIIHPVAVACILGDLGMDAETVIAGLLHDTVRVRAYASCSRRGEKLPWPLLGARLAARTQ